MKFLIVVLSSLLALFFNGQGLSSATITTENAQSLTQVARWHGNVDLVSHVAFSHDGSLLAIIGVSKDVPSIIDNGEVIFLDTKSFEPLHLTDKTLIATSIAFSPDGSLFGTGSETGDISIYNFDTFSLAMNIKAEKGQILDIAIDPSNTYVVVAIGSPSTGMEGKAGIQVFEIKSGTNILSIPNVDHSGQDIFGAAVIFDADNQAIIGGMTDGTVRKWSLVDKKETLLDKNYAAWTHDFIYSKELVGFITIDGLHVLPKDGDSFDLMSKSPDKRENAWSAALHPTEPIAAIGYAQYKTASEREGIIRLWDTNTRKELIEIVIPDTKDAFISDLAFSPDGTLLASGGTDGTVRLWGVPG